MNAEHNHPQTQSLEASKSPAHGNAVNAMTPAIADEALQLSARLGPIVAQVFQQAAEEMADLARAGGNTAKARLMLDVRRLLTDRRSQLRDSFARRFTERFTQVQQKQLAEARTQRDTTLGQHTPFGLARAEDHADLMLPKSLADAIRGQYHGFRFVGKQQVGIRPILPPSWSKWTWLPEILSIALKDTLSENGFGLNLRLAMLPILNAHLPAAFKSAMEAHLATQTESESARVMAQPGVPAMPPKSATPPPLEVTPDTTANPLLHALGLMQHALSVDAHNGVLYAAMSANGHDHVLRDLRDKGAPGLDNLMNSRMLEFVAMWFDLILRAQDIPDVIKAHVGKLQIPYLRLALQDRSFFTSKAHPARQLIDHLTQAARSQPANLSVLAQQAEAITQRILVEFRQGNVLFAELDRELQEFLHTLPSAPAPEPVEQAGFSAEQLKAAKKLARREVQERRPQEPLPEVIDIFLSQQLPALLALLRLNSAAQPAVWEQLMGVLDDLVESLTPSRWASDRIAMLAVLPSLLSRLDEAVKRGGIDQRKHDSLFSHLAKCHAAAMRTAKEAEPELENIEITAESAPAERQVLPATTDRFEHMVGQLKQGVKIRFSQANGEQTWCKLAWISPKKGVYLFVDAQGRRALTLSAGDLARRFRFGKAALAEASNATESGLMLKHA